MRQYAHLARDGLSSARAGPRRRPRRWVIESARGGPVSRPDQDPDASTPLGAINTAIDRSTLAGEPLADLAVRVVEPIRTLLAADRLAFIRYDVERGVASRLATARSYDTRPEADGPMPFSLILTPEYAAAPHDLVMPDLRDVPAAGELGTKFMLDQGLTCGALLPLVFDGRLQGGLVLGGFEPACLAPERLAAGREIARRLAVAMAHAAARERSERAI
ncbi:MAG: hypothetical protein U0838_01210, partial [Chloroflexota bacterium]